MQKFGKKLITTGLVSLVMGISFPNFNELKAQTPQQEQEQSQEKNPYISEYDKYKMYYRIENNSNAFKSALKTYNKAYKLFEREDLAIKAAERDYDKAVEKATGKVAEKFPSLDPIYRIYYKALIANLMPNEKNKGSTVIKYCDLDSDDFYDFVFTLNNVSASGKGILVWEGFRFYSETKKIDYILDFCNPPCEEDIVRKEYNGITQQEALSIGKNFVKRINNFIAVQSKFNRFNAGPLDTLIRQQAWQWYTKMEDGKYKFIRTGFPIYKYFSESEIGRIENALNEK